MIILSQGMLIFNLFSHEIYNLPYAYIAFFNFYAMHGYAFFSSIPS